MNIKTCDYILSRPSKIFHHLMSTRFIDSFHMQVTRRGRVTHMRVSKLSHHWYKMACCMLAIMSLSELTLTWTNFEIWVKIKRLKYKDMNFYMSSEKCFVSASMRELPCVESFWGGWCNASIDIHRRWMTTIFLVIAWHIEFWRFDIILFKAWEGSVIIELGVPR